MTDPFFTLSSDSNRFTLGGVKGVKNLDALREHPQLEFVALPKGKRLDISALLDLPNLKTLRVAAATPAQIEVINALPALESLEVMDKLEGLRGLDRPLRHLWAYTTKVASGLDVLAGAHGLRTLKIGNNYSDLSSDVPLPDLPELRYIEILSNKQTSLRHLAHLSALEAVRVTQQKRLVSLEGLEGKALRMLDLWQTGVTDLTPVAGAPIEVLVLWSTPFKNLDTLESLSALEVLDASSNAIEDVEGLRDHTALESLDFRHAKVPVSDPSPLSSCTNLKQLDILTDSRDFSWMEPLQNLEALSLRDCRIDDLEVLLSLERLEAVSLTGTPLLEQPGVKEELEAEGIRVGAVSVRGYNAAKDVAQEYLAS